MNTHAGYRRHGYDPGPPSTVPIEAEINQLVHHRDPSLAAATPMTPRSKQVAWVRPTELAAYAAPTVGRGIDLQAELVRRARRTPATATRGLHRPPPARSPETIAARREGLEL
jgi:hypothetical protein